MLEYKNMRNELIGYLNGLCRLHDDIQLNGATATDYHAAWGIQMFANDFILEDINIMSNKSDWVGAIFYDKNERLAIQKLGGCLERFYNVGEADGYVAAFSSTHWEEACAAASIALELLRQNDIGPRR